MTDEEQKELIRRIDRKFSAYGRAGIHGAEILCVEAKEIIKAYKKEQDGNDERLDKETG